MISHTVDDEYSEFSQYYIDEHYSEIDHFHIKQSMLVVAILPNYLKSDSPVVKSTTFPAF